MSLGIGSRRPYVNSETEKLPNMSHEKPLAGQAEMESEGRDRHSSTSTATSHSSQSSLQASPTVQATKCEQDVEALTLESQGSHGSDATDEKSSIPLRHRLNLAHSTCDLEYSLPKGTRPANFGVVVPDIYRSSFPQSEHYSFVGRLKLKTIMYVADPRPCSFLSFDLTRCAAPW